MNLLLSFQKVNRLWHDYWFKPAPLLNLAICRLVIVGFQVVHLLLNNRYYDALKGTEVMPDSLYDPLPIIKLIFFPFGTGFRPGELLIEVIFWLTVISGITGLIGLKTRWSLITFAVGNLIIQGYLYSFGDYHHPEALMMISLFAIAFSPAGKLLSIDYLLYRSRRQNKARNNNLNILELNNPFAGWSLLVIRWLFALVYLDAGMSKLKDAGLSWINGYTLRYYLLQDGMRWDSDLGVWLAQQHELAIIASAMAILFEISFFLVLVFPPLALIYVPLGASLHIGIYLAQRAPFFQYLALYVAFVPWTLIIQKMLHKNHSSSLNKPRANLK